MCAESGYSLGRLGVWRSLVARSVRVGEVPSSNLGTPTGCGGTLVPPRSVRLQVQSYPGAMPDRVRVACVQMTSRADKSANLEKAERLVAQAAATGADVVVLPEKWNAIGDAAVYRATAEPIEGGESVNAMSAWARAHGITLVGGSIAEFREGREKLSNTSLVFDPEGRIVATYRKIHLFDVEVGGDVYRESEAEEPGDEQVDAEREDWSMGLSMC